MTEQIKILFLAANSADETRRRLEQEAREIRNKIRLSKYRDSFELITQWAVRPRDLQEVLLEHEPHIVHFSGRGTENQGVILETDAGQIQTIREEVLTSLFRTLKDNIRIILFNACYTNRQAAALAEIVDYAIGISESVGAETAVTFSAFFYQALAYGRTVQEAFDLAVNQLRLESVEEYKKPSFKTRPGVDTSQSFLEQIKQVAPPPKASGGWPFRSISAALHKRCREVFELCDEFSSPENLRAFFHKAELRPFARCVKHSVRLDLDELIYCLQNSGRTRPALLDLLEQLAARYEDDYKGELCGSLRADIGKELA